MKKALIYLSVIFCIQITFVFAGSTRQSQPTYTNSTRHKPTKKPAPSEEWLKDQNDQTDTYAIPFDSSEEEDEVELEKLQPQKKPAQSVPNKK